MDQKRVKKSLRILSYCQIKNRAVFEAPKKAEKEQKTGAKLLRRPALALGSLVIQAGRLKSAIRKFSFNLASRPYLKANLPRLRLGNLEKDKNQELSSRKSRFFGWIGMTKKKKMAIGVITAIVAVGGVFAFLQTRVGAISYDWLQTTWSDGQDQTNYPRHGQDTPGVPKQNWTKFWSKDAQINTSNDELKIAQTDASWTETDDASGFAAGTKSNTYSSGTGIWLKKNNGVACTTAQTTDYECTSGNCDGDFSSGNYCHATASSCVDYALGTPWERADGYELCSGNSYYKSCANSVWGAQQNCDTTNDYCDAGGGAQSGYDLAETCTSAAAGGCNATSCTSCSPYMAASTSSCRTSCTGDSHCWSGYGCGGGACLPVCSSSTSCGSSCAFGGLAYGTVTANGRCWLDRNLGATAVATAHNSPTTSYGDLYQWGRLKDGHQVRTSGAQTGLSSSDTPGHANFIYGMGSPYDWRSPQNHSLWQGVSGINNPCPAGWRLPTQAEWSGVITAMGLSGCSSNCHVAAASSVLKLPSAGSRFYSTAALINDGSSGFYWSSTANGTGAYYLRFLPSGVTPANYIDYRANGFSVRCLKN